MSSDLYASTLTTTGAISCAGAIVSASTIGATGAISTNSTMTAAGNVNTSGGVYQVGGVQVLSGTALASAVTSCSLTNTSGTSFTITGTANNWSLYLTNGFIKPQGVYAKISSTSAGTISDSTSLLTNGSATYDNYPTGLGSYGFITSSGTYQWMYRAPCAGVYQITLNVRLGDSTSTTYGFKLYKFTGSVLTSLIPSDGFIWLANDGSNRRCGSYQTQILLPQGNAVFPTVYGTSISTSWCEMDVLLLHAT